MRVGILPAGGAASRWNGFPKELLPVSDTSCLLDRAVITLQRAFCDKVYIVTNPVREQLQRYVLKTWAGVEYIYDLPGKYNGFCAAMMAGMQYHVADEYLVMMPDTYTDMPLFPVEKVSGIKFGRFPTDQPGRFGMFRGPRIEDKNPDSDPGFAWGAFMFDQQVRDIWLAQQYETHTAAFNDIMKIVPWDVWEMYEYRDIASWNDYLQLLGVDLTHGNGSNNR